MGNHCCIGWKAMEPQRAQSFRKNMLLEPKNRDIFEVYDLVEVVGEGSISTISKIRKKDGAVGGSARISTDEQKPKRGFLRWRTKAVESHSSDVSFSINKEKVYALKTIDLRLVNDEYLAELRNEIEIFKNLDHPNIVKAYETFEYKRHMSIVMELCTGGDLYARNPYTERESANIVGKVLSAVAYMHKNKIIHRDLKFENVMFESPSPKANIKVIDFGLSKKYLSPDHIMTERVGTVYTMAPQVIQKVYTSQADLWSVGVITYMLLSGTKPFWGKNRKRIISKIMSCKYNFNGNSWKFISKEAKDFVSSLLKVNPKERLNAKQAQKHRWLSKEYALSDRRPDESVMDRINESIVCYADSGEFKKVALNVVAHKSSADEILQLREAFDQYDQANDGTITYKEFKEALAKFNYTEEELDAMFRSVDVNRNGVIFYTEFLAATLEAHGRIEEERLADAFDRIDSDDTGFISKENLCNILGTKCSDFHTEKLIDEVDVDGDGQVSYKEFLAIFREKSHDQVRYVYDHDSRRGRELEDDSDTDDGELLDENSPIPGGKHFVRQ